MSGRLESASIIKVFICPLWANPLGRFQANVAMDGVEEGPGGGEVAWIDVEALLVSGVAEDGPGDTHLKL
jgi:hypothetical protein